jgi:hypothetical protein
MLKNLVRLQICPNYFITTISFLKITHLGKAPLQIIQRLHWRKIVARASVDVFVSWRVVKVICRLTTLSQFDAAIIVCKVLAHALAWQKYSELTIRFL